MAFRSPCSRDHDAKKCEANANEKRTFIIPSPKRNHPDWQLRVKAPGTEPQKTRFSARAIRSKRVLGDRFQRVVARGLEVFVPRHLLDTCDRIHSHFGKLFGT